MPESLSELLVAVVSYVTEHGGYVTKTKLLKLAYLFDVEFYRVHGQTFTGFRWKYYHLGPWTNEFDPLLERLVQDGSLTERQSDKSEFDTKFLGVSERIELRKPFSTYRDELILKCVLDTWGPSTTGEILDYVYFRTEPMERGIRNEVLDFSTIPHQPPAIYKRPSSGKTVGEIKALRKEFDRKLAAQGEAPKFEFTPPNYDDEFLAAVEKLDSGSL